MGAPKKPGQGDSRPYLGRCGPGTLKTIGEARALVSTYLIYQCPAIATLIRSASNPGNGVGSRR